MKRFGATLGVLFLSVGCGPSPLNRATAALSTPRTVYLAFDGVTLTAAGSDDAALNQSALSAATVPAFDSTSAPSVPLAVAQAAVVDRVRGYFAPYAIDVVTAAPTSGDYTLVAMGGVAAVANEPAASAGVAQLDCTATNPDHVDFDFSAAQSPDEGGVVNVAITAAHEVGHSLGLEHTSAPLDLMYVVAAPTRTLPNLFQLGFVGGSLSGYAGEEGVPAQPTCSHGDPVDEHAVLTAVAGASTPTDSTAPALSWTLAAGAGGSYDIDATASDDVGVVRVEIYVNLDLRAAPSAPPYSATVVPPSSAQTDGFFVTVEAIDAAANRVSQTRYVPAPGSTDGGLDGGVDGGISDAGSTNDGGSSVHHAGGCSYGTTPNPIGRPLFLFVVALAVAVTRARRRVLRSRGPTL